MANAVKNRLTPSSLVRDIPGSLSQSASITVAGVGGHSHGGDEGDVEMVSTTVERLGQLPTRIGGPYSANGVSQLQGPTTTVIIKGPNDGAFRGIRDRVSWMNQKIPADGRMEVVNNTAPLNLVVRLVSETDPMKSPGVFKVVGSGAIVGPRAVLTAAHCLVDGYGMFFPNIRVIKIGAQPFTVKNRYINSYFLAGPNGNVFLPPYSSFATYDYAVVGTHLDMVGPNDPVFSYNVPTDNILSTKILTHAGVPFNSTPFRGAPIPNPPDPKFNGWPFGYAGGRMLYQTGRADGPFPSPYSSILQADAFDFMPGQSGGPFFTTSANSYIIYAMASYISATGSNYAHKITEESYDYITEKVALTEV